MPKESQIFMLSYLADKDNEDSKKVYLRVVASFAERLAIHKCAFPHVAGASS